MINHTTRERFWVTRILACDDDQRREALYESMPMNEKYATVSAVNNDVWLDMKLPDLAPPEVRESSVYAQLQDCVRNLPDTPRTKWLIDRIVKDVTRDLEHKLKG
ncbi:hypothetical protein LCGC14_1315520 [marine sediment metagenome]|uniref:Uncharacterized protein n=1 Tax=marine sediment metagenome TaxID=412755 RepID=A0A0F9N1Z2_9ZZZZ